MHLWWDPAGAIRPHAAGAEVPRDVVAGRAWSEGLWRYAELLPVVGRAGRISLGEGATPLLPLGWLSSELGCSDLAEG